MSFQNNAGGPGLGQPTDGTLRINGVDVQASAQVRSAFLTQPGQMEAQGVAVNARMGCGDIVEFQKRSADCRKLLWPKASAFVCYVRAGRH